MPALTIGLEFITGRCVAASVHDRDQPEWPPHPARVFMALAAACFEMGEDANEVAALQWLESLPAPEIHASEHHARSPVKFYVPVNDKITPTKAILQSTPGLARSKQERSYPTAIPLDPTVKLVWPEAAGAEKHIDALARVCANVIRVGHSSSLVRAWAELSSPDRDHEQAQLRRRWQPASGQSHWPARIVGAGAFERLRRACKADRIELFASLKVQIESTKGKLQKEAKQVFESEFGEPFKTSLRAPEPTPPTLGLWQGYRPADESVGEPDAVEGRHFDSELLILAKQEGPNIGIRDCLALTSRLRDAAMSWCPDDPVPAWLGGHEPDTRKPTELPHTAFLALPFVGHPHADGHIMGLALALPTQKQVPLEERGRLLGPLLFDDQGEMRNVELKLGRLGTWTLRLEERVDPPRMLQNSTWTRSNCTWASVTPVVLDKFPKASRAERRSDWEAEVRRILAQSCQRAGLPEPVEIDIDTTSWHIGAPRAFAKTRKLRGKPSTDQRVPLGDGFASLPARPGKPARPQIHVYLRFGAAVRGPVLLGAGRFLGYGMCKPVN